MNKLTLEPIRQKGGWFLAGADDTYILGPPDVAFLEVKLHEERLKLIGLELSYPKMKCFIAEEHRNKTYHQAREATGIAEEIIESESGDISYGVKAYGVPIGTKEYIANWLERKSKKIISNLREISDILDPNTIFPAEIPTRQCLWYQILTCFQFKGNYFVRHTPPQFTESLCDQIDSEINIMIVKCFQIDFSTLSPFIQKRINLPIKLGGIGVRQLRKLRWSEYMGGIVPLLDK